MSDEEYSRHWPEHPATPESLVERSIQRLRDNIARREANEDVEALKAVLIEMDRLVTALSLAQTEIKGHMRIEDDLKAENAKWLAKAMLYAPAMEQAQVRIAELEKDAARYRWLRIADSEWSRLFADPIKWEGGAWVKLGSRWVREHLDAAIDAALKDRA